MKKNINNQISDKNLSVIFNAVIDEINEKYKIGTLSFIQKQHSALYIKTMRMLDDIENIWKDVLKGNASIGAFETVLMKWKKLIIQWCNLFIKNDSYEGIKNN